MAIDITQGGMYLVIPISVAGDCQLRERSKLVYGRIVQLAAATGYCYASNQALLEILTFEDPKTGVRSVISERTLQIILAELRDRGHIFMDNGPVPCSGGDDPVIRRRIFVGQRLADSPHVSGGEKNCTPAIFCTHGVKKISPPIICKNNTSKNNKPPISPAEVFQAIDEYIGDDPEYRAAFEGFLENRAAMKKPVRTARAVNAIINKLRRVNHRETEIAMLDKATVNNWLTVYPLKADELPESTASKVQENEGVTYF